jgi:hypothetical protein
MVVLLIAVGDAFDEFLAGDALMGEAERDEVGDEVSSLEGDNASG